MNQPHVNNNMAKAILTTICCCFPFGIVAIIKAAEVNGKLAAGDVQGAQFSAAEADKWGNYALICGIVWIVLYFILVFLGALAGI
jgi:tryptophan-rich sensory protein